MSEFFPLLFRGGWELGNSREIQQLALYHRVLHEHCRKEDMFGDGRSVMAFKRFVYKSLKY